MVPINAILIIFAAKVLARYLPFKYKWLDLHRKPFNCDLCITFWISLYYFYQIFMYDYFIITIYSLANAYGCVLVAQIKDKFGYVD